MEIPASSLLLLLRNFSEVVGRESETDSDKLLGKIFEERIPHGADDNTELLLPYPEDDVNCRVVNQLFEVLNSKKIFGRNNEKEQILSRLIGPDKEEIHLSWIPIFGVPGIGKTTLAQLVYDEEAVQKHFELRVWVKVVGKEFGLPDIARGILKSDTGMTCPLDDLEDLDEMVTDTLQSHKCLIVLDEIEFLDKKTWLYMKHVWFNVVGFGSMVLITTSSKEVADLVSELPFEMGKLSLEAGWSLYESLAFDSPGVVMPADVYQGIPLLLKLLGCLSRFEEKISELLSNKEFLDSAMSFMNVFVVVLLSIWALPPNLMQCFAYCAIFPPECPLNKEKIIKMWIAEGFIKHSHGSKTLEDIGNACLRHLLCRSFFTDIICNEYGDIVEFRIPGLIHKLAQDVSRTVFKSKVAYIGSISEDADKLSLAPSFTKESDWKHLQTLIFLSNIILGGRLDLPLSDFKHLQTVDLSFSSIEELSGDIGLLYELRYLNLSYTLIERLPDSIVNLNHLQTLILSGCYNLTVLPKKMRELTRLKHLDLWQCDSLSCLPSGIGSLSSLQSLPLFALGSDPDCACLSELEGLNKLTGILKIKNLEHVKKIGDVQHAQLNKKTLLHLGLSWSRKTENCDDVVRYLEPNEQLEVLELTRCMGVQFPLWLPSISGLIKIFITDCGWVELPPLGHLPLLKELQLKRMPNLKYIGVKFYGHGSGVIFPSLELLGLYDMPNLRNWYGPVLTNKSESSASMLFCNLNTLTIEGCPKLTSIPSFFPVLSELVVCNSSINILSSLNAVESLQSLLIDGMELRFYSPPRNQSVKKLIILNGKDIPDFFDNHLSPLRISSVEHLGILHCHTLVILLFFGNYSIQKLNIGYCSTLRWITIGGVVDLLIELVIEDCPQLQDLSLIDTPSLQKLIIKHCPRCDSRFVDRFMPPKLQYLLITGCPLLEERLRKDSSMVSRVPCVILGNQKLETNHSGEETVGKGPTSNWAVLQWTGPGSFVAPR